MEKYIAQGFQVRSRLVLSVAVGLLNLGGTRLMAMPVEPTPTPQPASNSATNLQPSSNESTTLVNSASPLNPSTLGDLGSGSPQDWGARGAKTDLDLNPEIIQNSPVLQRWQRQVPDVWSEIKNDPSFRTRVRLGYSQFPSTDHAGGWNVGVEDIFLGRSGLTVSGEYQAAFNGDREAYGGDLRYYVRPLGSYVNVAPVVGYRHLETEQYSTDGANVGVRVLFVLSRTGAADVSLTQSWVSPGSDEEVGLTTLSAGYAVTNNLRLSTDIQKQNSRFAKDSRVGVSLEWMP